MTESTSFTLDPGDELHARALARLEHERIAWFTSIDRGGFPHAVPVWFVWHEGEIIVMSEPHTVKVKNVRRDSKVLVHLESGADEEQLTVFPGIAEISEEPAPLWLPRIGDAYRERYAERMTPLDLTLESMFERYRAVIRVRPTRLITW